MEEKFNEINEEYSKDMKEMLIKGELPLKDTGIGFWGGSVLTEVFELFKRLNLSEKRSLVDLGSGDGRVVLAASLFGVNATGVEIDEELHNKAREKQFRLGIPNAVFYNDDFLDHGLSAYDYLYCSPDKPISRELESKLHKEMAGKLIVQGHHFHPQNLNKEKSYTINGTLFTVYGKR